MGRVLYIQSSPRQDSASSAVAEEFLRAYREAHPDCEIATVNLWEKSLPRFDGKILDAKYRYLHGQQLTPDETAAWGEIVALITEFKSADTYVFSAPMWNFSIPYPLKHYIDILVQPGLTFSFSPETGYQGLVTDRTAVIAYASGSTYNTPETQALDLQQPYLQLILGFMGVQDIRPLVVAPTLGDEASVKEARESAMAKARSLAYELI